MDPHETVFIVLYAIMFLCASRLPSFAPGVVPSHRSRSQATAGPLPLSPLAALKQHPAASLADFAESQTVGPLRLVHNKIGGLRSPRRP